MSAPYQSWLTEVKAALASINMPFDEWQAAYPFDFQKAFTSNTTPNEAARQANTFWWNSQPFPPRR